MSVVQTIGPLAAMDDQLMVGPMVDQAVLVVALPGNLEADVIIEGSLDSKTWAALPSALYGDLPSLAPTHAVTGNELLVANVSGLTFARVRVLTYTSGSSPAAIARASDALVFGLQ